MHTEICMVDSTAHVRLWSLECGNMAHTEVNTDDKWCNLSCSKIVLLPSSQN